MSRCDHWQLSKRKGMCVCWPTSDFVAKECVTQGIPLFSSGCPSGSKHAGYVPGYWLRTSV